MFARVVCRVFFGLLAIMLWCLAGVLFIAEITDRGHRGKQAADATPD